MDEAKLQEIEAKSLRAVPKCNVCNATARWTTGAYRMVEDFCEACAPRSRFPLERIQFAELDSLDLVAEVRRLTAALATVTAERDEHCRPVQVVAGVAVRSGRVLLIRSKRHGVATPGGKVRIGETHADALRRELREETGLEVVRVGRYLHTDVQPAFQCHLYAVEVSESEPVAGDDAEAAWWGDPAEILASNIPRDYPLVLDVIRNGIGTHDDAPWFAAALATARREGAEEMRRAAGQVCHDVYLEDPSAAVAVCIDAIRALPLDAPGGAT